MSRKSGNHKYGPYVKQDIIERENSKYFVSRSEMIEQPLSFYLCVKRGKPSVKDSHI